MPGQSSSMNFSYSGRLSTFVAPATGEYQIIVNGASGGMANRGQPGGSGAIATGVFVLAQGSSLQLVVGGMGTRSDVNFSSKIGGGGGGGSFVIETFNGSKTVDKLILVAGGGGGAGGFIGPSASSPVQGDGINGQTVSSGAAGIGAAPNDPALPLGGAGGSNGNGGSGGRLFGGGGGGVSGGEAGGAFVQATAGGSVSSLNYASPDFSGGKGFAGGGDGGFGGGGGASGGGGGGGGYGGGGGGTNNATPRGSDIYYLSGSNTTGQGGGGGSLDLGSNGTISVGKMGNGSIAITPVTTANPAAPQQPSALNYLEVLPGSGTTNVAGAQFVSTDTGATLVNTSGEDAVVALGAGNSTLIGGAGNSAVICEGGNDIYGFLNGHAGGQEDIYNFNGSDKLAFGGYTSNPIATEAVGATGDLIQLTDGTIINLVGVNHTVFS